MVEKILKAFNEKMKENKKLTLIVILGLAGIVLITLSEFKTNKSTQTEETTSQSTNYSDEDYSNKLEERLTDLLSDIENAGEVRVMITLKSTDENIYAVNKNIKNDEKSNSYSDSYVIIDNKNEKEGILLKRIEPQVQGVAVVCTGGDNPYVREQIISAVTTVLGIGSNNVSVSKMK